MADNCTTCEGLGWIYTHPDRVVDPTGQPCPGCNGGYRCEECHEPWANTVNGQCRRCGNRTYEKTPA